MKVSGGSKDAVIMAKSSTSVPASSRAMIPAPSRRQSDSSPCREANPGVKGLAQVGGG